MIENELSPEESEAVRRVLTAMVEHVQSGGTLPRCFHVEYDPEALPNGYEIQSMPHGLLALKKADQTLRMTPPVNHRIGGPVMFPKERRAKLVEYAWRHSEMKLEAHEEVPGFKYEEEYSENCSN